MTIIEKSGTIPDGQVCPKSISMKELKSMAYTPELYPRGSATLRRLAWFRGKPISKTLETLLEATGRTMAEIRPGEVCSKC